MLNRARSEEQRQAAKQARRKAYLEAKERRAKDPRYQELKAAAKARRREHYERVKEHRRAAQVVERAQRSAQRAQTECDERAFFQRGRVKAPAALQESLQGPSALAAELAVGGVALVANDVG